MKFFRLITFVILAALVLAACAQSGAPAVSTPVSGSPSPTHPATPTAISAAVQALAKQLGLDPSQIQVQSSSPSEWPDACLGVPQGGEMCAQVVTPGIGGILVANDVQYEFRTNMDGSILRFIPGAALSARQVLAQQKGLSLEAIRFVSIEKVEWPDRCLGVVVKGILCAQGVTPGYKVILEANGQQYEYHTDETGGTVLLASAPEANLGEPAIVWQSPGNICETAQISPGGVAFGACDGAMQTGQFVSPNRVEDLQAFIQTYASFKAETPAGRVTFTGQGSQQPTPAEERMLAEWAHLVFQEAAGGRSGASWGLALAWHREGGFAGFCDDLTVYVTGEVLATSCKGGQAKDLGRSRLSSAQLEQLYTWLDTYKNFEVNQKDAATADAMAVRLIFSGAGQQEPSEADKLAIQNFAVQLFTEAGNPAQ